MRFVVSCFAILLLSISFSRAQAQLPPGTTDASQTPQPSATDALLSQANDALGKQDYPAALKLLKQLAEKNPKDAHVLYNLGFVEDALNDETAAEDAYRRAIAVDASYFDPHLALGLLLARSGKTDQAHSELATAITLSTDEKDLKARAYRALARLDQTTDPSAASADLLAALQLSPESTDDALLAGELSESAKDYTSAEAAYRRILAAHPGDPAVTGALAHLLLSLKRAPDAEAVLKTALAEHPDDTSLSSQLAAAYAAQGKTTDALALVEQLHSKSPADVNISRLLAHLYSDNNEPEKAEPLYAELVASSPNDVSLLADQGEAMLRLKQYADAQAVLARATANPKLFARPEALGGAAEALAFAASHNGQPEIVLQALALRATVLPQSPVSLFLAATAHDTLHHNKQAAELYKQFLAAAAGKYPDQEWEASHRLIALGQTK